MTTDTAKDGEFYTGLFGWGKDEQQFWPDGIHDVYQHGERGRRRNVQMTPEMGRRSATLAGLFRG